ncbi:LRR receptor-like serine/threonine-protein kinase RKF3 [Artemisia annua]|uniref:LRR receptor-like serine/threonine-protein kinase RKF3 n=1 Tax=Artemisia annua TaxID=35608 RepID=A0A2U1NDI9_ARTAN|nr:LRR receptor-like serine/threonine-protein kinase RKF3 [Artemisia annua]
MYVAAFVNPRGPTDRDTAYCLFSLNIDTKKSKSKRKVIVIVISVMIGVMVLVGVVIGFWCYRSERAAKFRRRRRNRRNRERKPEVNSESALDKMSGSTSLIKYTIDDIKEATRNFARENIIGRGGYGNVYKGVLDDDSEVALKRFKNCSAAGDASFTHEVEVIASVRHVNLVALRGYCTATTPFEGYQRIIVCDLVKNGSLHDHLFGGQSSRAILLADWAWSMVRNGTPLEVIDSEMPECGSPEIMEKYVLVAVLSSHPQLYARPTMDQVLKMLDTDLPVPSIPERPIPLIAGIEDIERSVSDGGSGHLFTPRGYQGYSFERDARSTTTFEMDEHSDAKEDVDEEVEDEKARLSGSR